MQLSLRGLDGALERHIRELAAKEGISLNKAALRVLRRGAGLSDGTAARRRIGDALDAFIGSWDEARAREVTDATAVLDAVDDEFWK